MPAVTYQPNDILIVNDNIGSPAAIIDTQTGAIASYIDPFPAGEAGCCLPNGIFCISYDGEEDFAIYDSAFNQIAVVSLGTEDIVGSGIQSNRNDKFFIISRIGVGNYKIRKVALDGTIEQTISTSAELAGGPCILRDESILYYFQNNTVAIKRFDMASQTVLSDLFTIPANEGAVCGAVDPNGNIWYTFINTVANTVILRQFSQAGATLQTITLSEGVYEEGGRSHISSDDLAIWVWINDKNAPSDPYVSGFKEILFSNGTTRKFITDIPTKDNATTDAISNSCPLTVLAGSSSAGRDECVGGSLVGGDGGGGNSGGEWCVGCIPSETIPPQNWPAGLLADLLSVGINNCWGIGFIYAVEPLFNARGFTAQHDSAGKLRGRFYAGFPTPDFSRYFDTNGPDCEWKYSPHGI